MFSAAQSDRHSSAAAINSEQSKNRPADKGLGAIDIQGTTERRRENLTGEGVKIESSILTESYSGGGKPAAQKLGHMESPHGKSTGITASQVSPIQTSRDAAECDKNTLSGWSFVARKEVASLGDSSETTSRLDMASGHTQQQPLRTSEIQQQQREPAAHQQRNDQHRQQQMRPLEWHHDPTLTQQQQQQQQQQRRQLPLRPQQQGQHQQMLPVDLQHYNQHKKMYPADLPNYSQHQQMPSADRQHFNQHQKMSPTDRQQHKQQQLLSPADRQHFSQPQVLVPTDPQQHSQHQQMPPVDRLHYNQPQHLQQNQQKQPPSGGQVFDQQQPSSSTKQQHQQVDRQQCLNAEAIREDKRAEEAHFQPAKKAPDTIDPNGSSQASQKRRERDDPTTQTNDQSTKMLEGGSEVSL